MNARRNVDNVDIQELFKRLSTIEMEIEIRRRQNIEAANKAVSAIKQLSGSDTELLRQRFPEFETIENYTVDDILSNKHSEADTIRKVYKDMVSHILTFVEYYEGQL